MPRDRAGRINANGATLQAFDVEAADLSYAVIRRSIVIDLRAYSADLSCVRAAGVQFIRCDLSSSRLVAARLDDCVVEDSDFCRADLAGATWQHVELKRCRLAGAMMINTNLEGVMFVDCDLRGADLGIVGGRAISTAGAVFVGCDLRHSNWNRRGLADVTFVDCKLHGVRGTPAATEGVVIDRPDLSRAADGSFVCCSADFLRRWAGTGARESAAIAN